MALIDSKLPGEALVVAIINARMQWLAMLPEDLRNKVLAMDVENLGFWHDLLAPLRGLGKE